MNKNLAIFLLSGPASGAYFIAYAICVGIFIGVVASAVCRSYSGNIVSALIKAGADGKNSAKTLADLGFGKSALMRFMLREGTSLRKTLSVANEDEFPPENISRFRHIWYEKFLRDAVPRKTPFGIAKFYLPEENRINAELRYPRERHPLIIVVFSLAVLAAAAAVIYFLLPELLTMLDNFVDQVA